MNETVLVEFLFQEEEYDEGCKAIRSLGDDFQPLNSHFEGDIESMPSGLYYKVNGKLNSIAATAITLGNKFLADRMRVSYISDELKNKYRS